MTIFEAFFFCSIKFIPILSIPARDKDVLYVFLYDCTFLYLAFLQKIPIL